MAIQEPLEKFGKFIVENCRDRGIDFSEMLLDNQWKAPALLDMQLQLSKLSKAQKEIVQQAIIETIDTAIHDFLFALQERNDIQVLVDGENVLEISDGIHGEAFSEDGWYAKFSKFKPMD